MVLIDLSSPRKMVQNTIINFDFSITQKKHISRESTIVAVGALATLLSLNNITFAEGIKDNLPLKENYLFPNLFAFCEILKQTNYFQVKACINQIFKS